MRKWLDSYCKANSYLLSFKSLFLLLWGCHVSPPIHLVMCLFLYSNLVVQPTFSAVWLACFFGLFFCCMAHFSTVRPAFLACIFCCATCFFGMLFSAVWYVILLYEFYATQALTSVTCRARMTDLSLLYHLSSTLPLLCLLLLLQAIHFSSNFTSMDSCKTILALWSGCVFLSWELVHIDHKIAINC